MKNVLFVCTGNVCRSPMAEGIFRHMNRFREGVNVKSAGIGAVNGQPPSSNSVEALRQLGLDISEQRSQMLTEALVREADFIFGMSMAHVEAVTYMYPEASEKTFLLREFEEELPASAREVADPIGGNLDVYTLCRDQIWKGVEAVSNFIWGGNAAPAIALAMGCDHAGYVMKESLKSQLEVKGYEIDDLGTYSSVSTDYPGFAQAVARDVASGKHPFGVLICGSGVGMSIAANKIPGVRAALATSVDMARLSRQHNNANILCIGSKWNSVEEAEAMVDVFLSTEFEGGRHERRVGQLEGGCFGTDLTLGKVDPETAHVIALEKQRQQENIELIASENFTSPAVMEAQGSVLTNKYAEGYPGKRWYGGCEFVDEVEELAIRRAKELFGAEHANVQPHCGSSTNMAVYFAFLKPGDRLLTMDLSHGGHLTHGNAANFSGKFFEIVHYGVRKEDELIDYNHLAEMARQSRPKMITVGASAYPRVIDFKRLGEIAKEVDAMLLADIAHIAGLVAAGIHPSPVPYADFVTTTTHKTLRGPRGGLILCKADYAKKIDSQVFPGIQGGPLMHVIAAKAVCFQEAMGAPFREYQGQIVKNCQALAGRLKENGFRLVSGGTDNHLMLVDVGSRDLTGKECQLALDEAGITVNKNTIPFETRSPFQASGIRIGTPAVTTRGMKEPEMIQIADWITRVLKNLGDSKVRSEVRNEVRRLTAKYPLPY